MPELTPPLFAICHQYAPPRSSPPFIPSCPPPPAPTARIHSHPFFPTHLPTKTHLTDNVLLQLDELCRCCGGVVVELIEEHIAICGGGVAAGGALCIGGWCPQASLLAQVNHSAHSGFGKGTHCSQGAILLAWWRAEARQGGASD